MSAFAPLLAGLLVLAACSTQGDRARAAAGADAAAEWLLEGARKPGEPASLTDSAQAVLARRAGVPSSLRRERLLQVGPRLWVASYRFERLPLRSLKTARIRPTNGTLTVEIQTPAGGSTRLRSLSLEADVYLGPDPFLPPP